MARPHGMRAHALHQIPAATFLILLSLAVVPARADYRVAVVDQFFPRDRIFADEAERQATLVAFDAADIDGDQRRDEIYHGDLVALLLGHEGIQAVPYPIDEPAHPKPAIAARLRQIRDEVAGGALLDAVLLCWESSTLVSAFAGSLAPGHELECQAVLREWALRHATWRETLDIIEALEDLVDQGLTVVTVAGNCGSLMVNTYSFARGVVTVGDAAPAGDGRWIGDNLLVDLVAQASFPVRLVCDRDRPRFGYDIDGDLVADIPLQQVSSYRNRRNETPRETGRVLRGSSFAAPTALRRLVAVAAR